MSPSISILVILQHTPAWVWLLLSGLVGLGLVQTLPRKVTLRRATLLPLALTGLSLWGMVSVFPHATALAAWAVGLGAAAALMLRLGPPAGARWSAAEQRFQMPGTWVPLALILGIFGTRYGVGVSVALHPGLAADAAVGIAAGLAYGTLSGLFLGRAGVLWRVARRSHSMRTA